MRAAFKWLRRGALLFAGLFLLLVIVIVLVLNTETGTRWAVARIGAAVPGEMSVTAVEGTFWRGLRFDSLRYVDDSQDLQILNVDLTIEWSSVTIGRIAVEHLNAESFTRTSLLPAPETPTPLEVVMAPLPVRIAVEKASIDKLILQSATSRQEFSAIEVEKFRIVGNRMSGLAASATIEPVALRLSKFSITLADDVATNAEVSWRLGDNSWSGIGTVRGSLAELQVDQVVDSAYPGIASGTINILGLVDPLIDMLVHWDRWSIEMSEVLDGELRVRGGLSDYSIIFDTTIALDEKSYTLSGTADGTLSELTNIDAKLLGQAGQLELLGGLRWDPVFSANANVHATNVDPAAMHEALSGLLNGSATVAINEGGTIAVDELAVAGVLNEVALSASGNLLLSAARNECSQCILNVGDNKVSIDGHHAADGVAFLVKLQAPTLSQLWPDLRGSMTGDGRVSGSIDNPKINGTASLRQFSYQETEYGELSVSGQGSLAAAEIDADWQLDDLRATASATVAFEEEKISGKLRRATVAKDQMGSWELVDPFSFAVSANEVLVQSNEWRGELGDLQVTRIAQTGDTLNIVGNIRNVPLQMANTALPKNYQLFGVGSADVNLDRQGGLWIGTMHWEQSDTELRVTDVNGETTKVIVPRMTLQADLRDGGMQANAAIEIEPGVTGDLELQLSNLAIDAPMTASLLLKGDDWGWISSLVPQVDRFEGAISAAVSATGPLNEPEFSGTLEWHDGRLVVPSMNVPLEQIDVVVTGASAGTATITGSARAGDGDLQLSGLLHDIMQDTRSATFTLKGDGAELINWPEYHIWGSPDIVLTGNSQIWRMGGRFEVPRANIVFREVPVGSVSLSPDVIVQGEEDEAQSRTKFAAETRLLLGERVHFDALGLETRLVGDVFLKMVPDRPPHAEGKVSLVDGTFMAQGQRLKIEQGTLTFTGPLDDPIVDVRAVRVIETFGEAVTVGIHLRGRAQNLTTTVYSNPPMADADALSYLVVGRPLSQATESDGGKLSGAAVALGLQQASRVTDQIGQVIGLDQLALAGDGGDTTALVAGKQINPRLHARYAYNVFSRLGTLLLRYRISRRLTLEAGAGENQSIDVLYSVEK